MNQVIHEVSEIRNLAHGVIVADNMPVFTDDDRKVIYDYLRKGRWEFGWKSHGPTDVYSFWHWHFAGYRGKGSSKYDCEDELDKNSKLMAWVWKRLKPLPLFAGRQLVRCYANCQTYGSEGTIHTDSRSETSITALYYPHPVWQPNWAGETVFFNPEKTDIIASCYPKPHRLLLFKGTLPHVARAVARTCPEMRITLMFKASVLDDEHARRNSKKPAIGVPEGLPESG